MNLVLIGYRGTGKSCVAAALGRALDRQVVSLDAEIARSEGRSIPEIVMLDGWPHFRDAEEAACRRASALDQIIIDCGGGVVEREANFDSLRRNGSVFWLKASTPTILARIGGNTERPSLTGSRSFTDEIDEVLERRTPLYHRLAHVEIETDARSVEDVAEEVARRFSETIGVPL